MGSIAPSSRFLAKKMVKYVDFEQAKVIVELGAGNGAITAEIVKHLAPETQFLIIEKNPELAAYLSERFPKVNIINDDAAHLQAILEAHGGKADYIISGLPFTCFTEQLRNTIFEQIKLSLKPSGLFVAFQYSKFLNKLIKQNFTIKKLDFTPLNIPPAFVYNCLAQ